LRKRREPPFRVVKHDVQNGNILALIIIRDNPMMTSTALEATARWLKKYKLTTAAPTLSNLWKTGLVVRTSKDGAIGDSSKISSSYRYSVSPQGRVVIEKHERWLTKMGLLKG